MKLYILIGLLVGLMACDRASDLQPADTAPAVPEAVVTGLTAVFPEAKQAVFSVVEKGNVWQADFQANGTYSVLLSEQGAFYSAFRQITSDQLPDAARKAAPVAIVQQAFQDVSAQKVVQGYKAVVSTDAGLATLLFDKAGELIYTTASVTSGSATEPAKPRPPVSGTAPATQTTFSYATVDQLPAPVQAYLTANFAGWTFRKGVVTVREGVKTVYVYLINGNRWAEAYFDESGKLLKSFIAAEPTTTPKPEVPKPPLPTTPDPAPMTQKDIPQAAQETLTKLYPGWVFRKGATTENGGYVVVIISGTSYIYVYFDKQWKLLPEKTTTTPTTPPTTAPVDPKPTPTVPTTPPVTRLTLNDIPQMARDAMTKLYPNWTFQKGITNEAGGYLVVISSEATMYYVTFDGKWVLVSVTKA